MDSVMLTDGPIDTNINKPLVQTNVNPDKDFLVTTWDLDSYKIQWKIFSAP